MDPTDGIFRRDPCRANRPLFGLHHTGEKGVEAQSDGLGTEIAAADADLYKVIVTFR